MNRSLFLATLFLFAPLAYAADPATEPEKPSKDDVPALIKQLGDDSPKVRDQASHQLRKVGKDALPALTEAAKSDDPEVVSRAQSVSRLIDEDLHPKPKPDPIQRSSIRLGGVGGGGGNVRVFISSTTFNSSGKTVSVNTRNGVTTKETTVIENDKTIKIKEDPEGIAVTTTEKKDGKDVSETAKAKDLETLKKENPKAFELYEKHGKDATVKIEGLNGGNQIKLNVGGDELRDKEIKELVDRVQKQADDARKHAEAVAKEAEQTARELQKEAEEQK